MGKTKIYIDMDCTMALHKYWCKEFLDINFSKLSQFKPTKNFTLKNPTEVDWYNKGALGLHNNNFEELMLCKLYSIASFWKNMPSVENIVSFFNKMDMSKVEIIVLTALPNKNKMTDKILKLLPKNFFKNIGKWKKEWLKYNVDKWLKPGITYTLKIIDSYDEKYKYIENNSIVLDDLSPYKNNKYDESKNIKWFHLLNNETVPLNLEGENCVEDFKDIINIFMTEYKELCNDTEVFIRG